MAIDHDQIFKRLIEAFFREFLELFCPAEERLIDFSRVEFLREEHFTDVERGLRRPLGPGGQSGTQGGWREVRTGAWRVRGVAQGAGLSPPDVPVLLPAVPAIRYGDRADRGIHGRCASWKTLVPDHFELSLAGKTFMRFEYHLVKLKNLDYRQFLESNNPLAYGLMAKMEYNRKDRVRLKADFLRWILACPIDPARQSLLVEFVETYVALADHEQAEFQQFVRSDPEYTQVQQMITTYEQKGIEEGKIRRGIEEGMKEGKQEGQAGRSDSGVGEEVWQTWR